MDVRITPVPLGGTVRAISSKSHAQRTLIAAALCSTPTEIFLNCFSQDILSTISAIKSMGCDVQQQRDRVIVTPREKPTSPIIFCGESGTAARLLLPVAAALYENMTITGAGSLLTRPFDAQCSTLSDHNYSFNQTKLPITASGRLRSGEYKIAGNISSQYISGFMFALPLLEGDSSIILTTPLQSSGYVDITMDVLKQFGIRSGYQIKGGQQYKSPESITVEGDWSNSSYWHCVGINVTGLNMDSLQKDKVFLDVCEKEIIDAAEIPDLVPILAIYAANKSTATQITNIERLRIKESDRVKSVMAMLESLGARISCKDNTLIIAGGGMQGGIVDSFNDHRIVMSAAIASCFCKDDVIIKNAEAVNKSYPAFFEDFKGLGGKFNVI